MKAEEFNKILEQRTESIKSVLAQKGGEYATGDRLYNFKRAAEIGRATPAKALWGMFAKHLVSVVDMVEGTRPFDEDMINEKIGDSVNYLILLEGILKESLGEFMLEDV